MKEKKCETYNILTEHISMFSKCNHNIRIKKCNPLSGKPNFMKVLMRETKFINMFFN